jgi:hypothetical protein
MFTDELKNLLFSRYRKEQSSIPVTRFRQIFRLGCQRRRQNVPNGGVKVYQLS